MFEKRRSPRRPLRLDVFLHYPSVGIIRGWTRDLSLEGMFVEIQGPFRVPRGAELRVSIPLERGLGGAYDFCARVVHSQGDGVGLVLYSADVEAMRALDRWLKEVA